MEKKLAALRKRARELKKKRPGYGDILDFYVKIREAQAASTASLKLPPIKPGMQGEADPAEENTYLIGRVDFPVDLQASVDLFHNLCRIGSTANTRLAEEMAKIVKALDDKRQTLETLLANPGQEQTIEETAAALGLDGQILSFLIRNSARPSIEAGIMQLQSHVEPEKWRKNHCPVCGCLPTLNILEGKEGKRYSVCSWCGFRWRIDRVSCAVCGSKEQQHLEYFYGEGEEACRIDVCGTCHHYIKTIDQRDFESSDPFLEDLATLHLDVIAVDRGYARCVPNPWGI
jgi:FdhE protein